MDSVDEGDASAQVCDFVTRDQRSRGWKREDSSQRKHPSLSRISLKANSMDKYVFCDNIVFNNMPIYTYLFFFCFFVFYSACYLNALRCPLVFFF